MTETITRIHKRIDDLGKRFGAVEAIVARQAGACEQCVKMVARHEDTLHGDNSSGLKAQVAVNTDKIRGLGDPAKKATHAKRFSLGAVATAVLAAIGAIVSAIFGGSR